MMKKLCVGMLLSSCVMIPDYGMNPSKKMRLSNGSAVAVNNSLDNEVLQTSHYGVFMRLWFLLDKSAGNPNAYDQNGSTALIHAAAKGHADVVRLLLVYGADVDAHDNTGTTALMVASRNGHMAVVQQLLMHDIHAHVQAHDDDVQVLMVDKNRAILSQGADVDAKDNEGCTALIIAAKNGFAEIVRILLEAEADPDLVDNQGGTAFAWAQANGHQNVVQVFQDHRAKEMAATIEALKATVEEWPECPIDLINGGILPYLG
jgi:ankyrin repeat protein